MIADTCKHWFLHDDGKYKCEMNPAWLVDDESCYSCSEFDETEEAER